MPLRGELDSGPGSGEGVVEHGRFRRYRADGVGGSRRRYALSPADGEAVRVAERIVGGIWIEQARTNAEEAETATTMLRRRRMDALAVLEDSRISADPALIARARKVLVLIEEAYAERVRLRDLAQRALAWELACLTAAAERWEAEAAEDRSAFGSIGRDVAPRTER